MCSSRIVVDYNCSYFLQPYISKTAFGVLALAAFLLATYVILTQFHSVLSKVALVLVFVGGLHNFIQRVMYNCVLDNKDFFGLFIFNIADLLISVGVFLLIFEIIKK